MSVEANKFQTDQFSENTRISERNKLTNVEIAIASFLNSILFINDFFSLYIYTNRLVFYSSIRSMAFLARHNLCSLNSELLETASNKFNLFPNKGFVSNKILVDIKFPTKDRGPNKFSLVSAWNIEASEYGKNLFFIYSAGIFEIRSCLCMEGNEITLFWTFRGKYFR